MQNFNNDDVKKMLEMLKEQAGQSSSEEEIKPQTTESSVHSDEDIKNMLKKHFSAEESTDSFEFKEDYSFDTVDFGKVDDDVITTDEIIVVSESDKEIITEEVAEEHIEEDTEEDTEEAAEEAVEETIEETVEEIVENVIEETDEAIEEVVGKIVEQVIEEEPQEFIEEIVEETVEETVEEAAEEIAEEIVEEAIEETTEESDEVTVEEIVEPTITEDIEEPEQIIEEHDEYVAEPEIEEAISEESINYDEVLEGQQGTVFNQFVEDFTGDLDDVVFEAEITESRAPDKQYTIFEDWEQLMKDKNYTTAEDGIIPPTDEELAYSAEIAKTSKGNTDYFNPVTSADLDAVDIALMVALGGESELNQTVGFEKIRQAVHNEEEKEENTLKNKKIYGFCGEEYHSLSQNADIKKKYNSDKIKTILKLIASAMLFLILIVYEATGWSGYELPSIFSFYEHPDIYVLAGMQLMFLCAAISYDKFIKIFKNPFGFASLSFIFAAITLLVSVYQDVLILTVGYLEPHVTFHSIPAFLLLLSLLYDLFDVLQQSEAFNIVSLSDKKLILEPYGKLRMGEGNESATGEIIDKDSYCISRVTSVKNFFERISKSTPNTSSKLISLILSCSVALCVMLVLMLMNESFGTIAFGFITTLSFTFICSAIFESEFAYFVVYRALKKYKTGIIGKSSVAEYGKCNIVYFDDYNVFNKKSVRTKGLKLYDNNEIYRVLYHTQAVFSKVGGPLKGVFEFATSEMVHSQNVEIKEVTKEGIVAVVDNRTSVHIGTGAFMKSRGIHPSYTAQDLKVEERGDESIMFIALGGKLGAKLYVTYQFSAEFEKLARKLAARGVGIGIRSCDPNINNKWAKKYGSVKKFNISIVRPTLKEIKPRDKSIEGGVVSAKNVRALAEALMMCIKLDSFEALIGKIRTVSVVFIGILSFALVLFSGINTVSMLALMLASALGASIMMLLTHFYIKR